MNCFWRLYCTSCSTGKANFESNEYKELGMIDLNPTNVLIAPNQISKNQPKIGKGSTQFALVPLSVTLIYKPTFLYELLLSILCVSLIQLINANKTTI